MARELQEIYQAIVDEKDNQTSLQGLAPQADSLDDFKNDLNSSSKVAKWRLFAYLVALAIWTLEVLWDMFKKEIQEIVDKSPAGTSQWYQDQVFDYQEGYALTYINDKYQYTTIDEAAKIVKLCAVIERNDGVLLIKVAKLSANNPVPLTTVEYNALQGYLQKIKFAGTPIALISDVADLLKIVGEVFYDPLFPLPTLKTNVEQAVTNYIKNLPFNGVFKVNSLIDAVQEVQGVTDFVPSAVEAKYGALPYTNVTRTYIANAGYLGIDSAFPLSSALTYTPSTD